MNVLSASRARKEFLELIDRASNNLEEFIITKQGDARAVIMSIEEFDSWKETLEVMSDQQIMTDIRDGIEDIKAGRIVEFDLIDFDE